MESRSVSDRPVELWALRILPSGTLLRLIHIDLVLQPMDSHPVARFCDGLLYRAIPSSEPPRGIKYSCMLPRFLCTVLD